MSNRLITPDMLDEIRRIDNIESKHPTLDELEALEASFATDVTEMPIKGSCRRNFKAAHNSGRRSAKDITLAVIHCTQGSTARAAAVWFQNTASAGSAHIASDDNECYRCLDDLQISWGAPGANFHGMHFEQAGFVTWLSLIWMKHRKTIDRTAFKVALRCKKYGIPAKWLNAKDLKAGNIHGITSHRACTKAFGGTHTDPGPFYPYTYFMRRVRWHLANSV